MKDNLKSFFEHGANWVRADFHLHTNADKEFIYSGDTDFYNANYIEALVASNIRVGVITNHNKFDYEEFRALKSTAKKKGIFLLPGVELSVKEGANGVHTLIVFSDDWLEQGQDRISPFITSMFPGKTSEELKSKNLSSDKGLTETLEELDKVGRDYFLVFAHVEEPKGLWNELGGGLLSVWKERRYQNIRNRTLGFQKVRTNDLRQKVKQWLGGWYPAEIEGSDPKTIGEIGQGSSCFLKLGAFTFEAVKFALVDWENRLRKEPPIISHSHIRRIEFTGGVLDGKSIAFSPELNTLIGIRGSGKSSILESLRYALNIGVDANDSDREYKLKLVERTLGSGGKVVLDLCDRYGQPCQIRRIWRDTSSVFYENVLQPGVSIQETVLRNPLFFGQKELATAGKGSETDLIEKLLGSKCDEIRHQISDQKSKVTDVILQLSKVNNVAESIKEQVKIKEDAEFRLKFYEKHQLEEKLQKRLGFEADIKKAKAGVALLDSFIADLRELLGKYEDDIRNFNGYLSDTNPVFFQRFETIFSRTVQNVEIIKGELHKTESIRNDLASQTDNLISAKHGLAEEFASIERTLAEELKSADGQNISSDEFLALKKKLSAANMALTMLSKSESQKSLLSRNLYEELHKLNDLWHSEFTIIKRELDAVSQKNTALKFTVLFKEDKNAFLGYFKSIFKGSGIRDTTFQNIVEKYSDFLSIYLDFENARELFGSRPEYFAETFEQNLKELLTYQTPNKFTISYRGVELSHHSLGQRASALILFVLGQQENDVIIIDQPEDDLDNQTIYEDVIKLLRKLKPAVQFIFATHNPNIPVLGDAEQILVCSSEETNITIQSGGLDDPTQQGRIVSIMEGGKEAFERRREIYQVWNPLNS